jgi:hypothetical protein
VEKGKKKHTAVRLTDMMAPDIKSLACNFIIYLADSRSVQRKAGKVGGSESCFSKSKKK